MAVDTPAKIAILGAGPIGLEAGLYARFLGYDVELFERGGVAANVQRWGHVRLFSPFRMNATPLGIAAIQAHDETYRPPDPDELLTGHEWLTRYLAPLATTDLLADHLRRHTTVRAVARRDWLKDDRAAPEDRAESPFRILVNDDQGREWESSADVVIDTTGVYRHPNWIGQGGAPALGERRHRDRIWYDLPNVLGTDRERYANKRVLVVGAGFSAATTVLGLVELAATEINTRVSWTTRRQPSESSRGPIREIPNDPLTERACVTRAANQIAAAAGGIVTHWPGTTISALAWDEVRKIFTVNFAGQHAGEAEFDEIVANVGYRPDNSLYAELQVHECYASSGPMKLAAKLLTIPPGDCLQQKSHGPDSLINPEPNFYILGAKSYGRNSDFLLSIGHQQIRELFTIIADREDLDLYRGAQKLLQ